MVKRTRSSSALVAHSPLRAKEAVNKSVSVPWAEAIVSDLTQEVTECGNILVAYSGTCADVCEHPKEGEDGPEDTSDRPFVDRALLLFKEVERQTIRLSRFVEGLDDVVRVLGSGEINPPTRAKEGDEANEPKADHWAENVVSSLEGAARQYERVARMYVGVALEGIKVPEVSTEAGDTPLVQRAVILLRCVSGLIGFISTVNSVMREAKDSLSSGDCDNNSKS